MQIRTADASDLESITKVHVDAFGDEGATVSDLALALIHDESAQPLLALVAEEDSEVVGSIIFSSVYIKGAKDVSAFILAPLAVKTRLQRMGIGRELIENGLRVLRERGAELVFVLGDPGYYARFGFSSYHKVSAPYELQYPEAWMAMALQGIQLKAVSGRLVCARSLSSPQHW
ncbi:MAG: N-acetyltransferase [Desulfovermiculus sp.]